MNIILPVWINSVWNSKICQWSRTHGYIFRWKSNQFYIPTRPCVEDHLNYDENHAMSYILQTKRVKVCMKNTQKKVTIDCIVEQECGSDFYFNTAQRWNRMTLICMNGGSRFKQNLYVYTLYMNILFASKYLLHKIQVLVKSKCDCWMIVYVNNSMIFSQKNYSRAPLIQTPKGNEKQLLGVWFSRVAVEF